MGIESTYEIHQNANIKLILHELKHKISAVNGVLLGRVSGDDAVEIVELVPLFHSQIGVLPPLEIALIMVYRGVYCAKGLSIVAYFYANERFDDSELGNVANNIPDHIYRYFPQAAVLLLDNKKLEVLSKEGKDRSPVMQLYTKDASRSWKLVGSDGSIRLKIKEPSANVVLLDYISSGKWNEITDFDEHLDDISKDWVNTELFN